MRCLVIGGDGMLGHQLLKSWQARHDVRVTLRGPLELYAQYRLFTCDNAFDGVEVRDTSRLRHILAEFQPNAVVNAVGIIKQQAASKEFLPSLEINALFPHRLRLLCQEIGARLIQVSTDCVFTGRRGNYTERDVSDAEDLYGMSKFLGEVSEYPAITLRSSIIGLELSRKKSLIEWFLGQIGQRSRHVAHHSSRHTPCAVADGTRSVPATMAGNGMPRAPITVKGFTRAIYTGLTTQEMARVMEMVLLEHPRLSGVWQPTSPPISKYDLLATLARSLGRRDVQIVPDDTLHCDRSLCGEAFSRQTGYRSPSWEQMLAELATQINDTQINDSQINANPINTEEYSHAAA